MDFVADDETPLLSKNQSFSTPPMSPPLQDKSLKGKEKQSRKKQHSPGSSPSSQSSKKQRQ